MPPGKRIPPKQNPTPKVNYSKGIMGSQGPTLIPKTVYGSTYFVPTTKSTTTTNNPNTSGGGSGGGGNNITIEGVTSLRYGELEQDRRDAAAAAAAAANRGSGGGGGLDFSSSVTPTYTPPDVIVRTPNRDVVNYQDENIPTELITNLLFENLGANELLKFERHDTIEGLNARYDIISNLTGIKKEYDPAKLISRQKPDTSYFDIYNIKLDSKIPDNVYLANNNLDNFIYIDTNGDLIIELNNINLDELVEVEIDSSGTIYKVTI